MTEPADWTFEVEYQRGSWVEVGPNQWALYPHETERQAALEQEPWPEQLPEGWVQMGAIRDEETE